MLPTNRYDSAFHLESSLSRAQQTKPFAGRLRRMLASRAVRFPVVFAGCLLFGTALLLTPPMQTLDGQFSCALVGISKWAIDLFGGHARVAGAVLRAPSGFAVEMRDGCNGVNVTILLWSAVLAFPAPWTMKALGLAAGYGHPSGAEHRPLRQPLLYRPVQHDVVRFCPWLSLGIPAGARYHGRVLAVGQSRLPLQGRAPCHDLDRRPASCCAPPRY